MDFESALKESQAREVALLARLEASEERERKALEENETLRREKEALSRENEAERVALARKHEAMGHFPPFRMPFAGESDPWSPDSVLSHCSGALLPMFDTAEATELRLVCREFKETVEEFPWNDDDTCIKGSILDWRTCFSNAKWADVFFPSAPMVDADFEHLWDLERLFVDRVENPGHYFSHCENIYTLTLPHSYNENDEDCLLECDWSNLKGIHTLNLDYCQLLTDEPWSIVSNLEGIQELSLFGCSGVTNAVFTYIEGVKRLDIGHCLGLTLTIENLKGIEWLGLRGHTDAQIAFARAFGCEVSC